MRVMLPSLLACLLCAVLFAPGRSIAQVPIVIQPPGDRSADGIYVSFFNNGGSIDGFYMDGDGKSVPLSVQTPYKLSTITSGKASVGGGAPAGKPAVMVNTFESGRVYISFSSTLDYSRGFPDPGNTSDPNKDKRYQYLEPNISGGKVNVDLSYIDLLGIPLSMEAVNASKSAQNSPQTTSAKGYDLAKAGFSAASSSQAAYKENSVDTSGGKLKDDFYRVLTPHNDGSLYHDWSWLKDDKLTATLENRFNGVGDKPSEARLKAQQYLYSVDFDKDGNVTITGSGDAVGHNTITIEFSELNKPTGVYGANPAYTVSNYNNQGSDHKTGGIENDLYGYVVGDLLAGLDWGMVDSRTELNGSQIGHLSSAHWFGGTTSNKKTISVGDSAVGKGLVFSKAQSDAKKYDNYAANLADKTDGYASPFQDRLGQNLLFMDTGQDKDAYLLITINAD